MEESEAIYRETLRDWREMGNRGAIANQLECLAFLALEKGERVRAASLFGAAESLRESAGAAMVPIEHEEYEAAVARMRLAADGSALDAARADGREMGQEAAIEFAVATEQRAAAVPAERSSSPAAD